MSTSDRPAGPTDGEAPAILFVCTGNQCRSPMAAAILKRLLAERRSGIRVESAGFTDVGSPCPQDVLAVMEPLGYDLSAHRSRQVTPSLVSGSSLVIGMTRQHAVEVAVLTPDAWQRSFTYGELVTRGEEHGPRAADLPLRDWLSDVGAGRHRSDLLGIASSDDVPDPIGRSRRTYVRVRDRLLDLGARLADLVAPV